MLSKKTLQKMIRGSQTKLEKKPKYQLTKIQMRVLIIKLLISVRWNCLYK